VQTWRGPGEILAHLSEPIENHFLVEPALLDAGFQLLGVITDEITEDICVPVKAEQVLPDNLALHPAWVHAALRSPSSIDALEVDLNWYDEAGELVLRVVGVHLKGGVSISIPENPAD
jgi:hypothetical protein